MNLKSNIWQSRIGIVLLGVLLGLAGRTVLGPPTPDIVLPTREFKEPLPDEVPLDLPLTQVSEDQSEFVPNASHQNTNLALPANGWVEPFDFSELETEANESFVTTSATFEPHGEEVCASGCAISRNPTQELSRDRFQELLSAFVLGPMTNENTALESLLYYGPQTQKRLGEKSDRSTPAEHGESTSHLDLLNQELKKSHAKISIRVTDNDGTNRTWLMPSLVPLDRRHVFEMETDRLQPLVTSGTVKRVGLNHVWTRL